jgi:hypothetical protein
LDLRHRKSLRFGLLLLSTLFIVSASALVYAGIIYERALDVGNTGGASPGSGSTSAEVSFTPATIMMIAVVAVVIGLSVFGVLREASKRVSSAPSRQESSPTGPVPIPPGMLGIGLPLRQPSKPGEEWEESPKKRRGEE